jgi:hypothetical protein
MAKNFSSTVILGLMLILGVGLNLPGIQGWMTQVKTSTVAAQIRPVAEVGRYMDDLPTVTGYRITALNQSLDYVCVKATEDRTGQVYYYDTTSRVAGQTNCRKG